jgi:uncharacterized integral membrane protein
MSEDRGVRPATEPRRGSVGPVDPHADPVTDPGLRRPDVVGEPPTQPVPTEPAPDAPSVQDRPTIAHTRAGGLWAGLILSSIVLIFLLVFILQNGDPVRINFLAWSGSLPTGVALLLAAVAGLLLVAIPGIARIVQLRRAVKRSGTVRGR